MYTVRRSLYDYKGVTLDLSTQCKIIGFFVFLKSLIIISKNNQVILIL